MNGSGSAAAAILAALLAFAPAARGEQAATAAGPESVRFDEAVRRAVLHATISNLAGYEIRRAEGLLVETRSGALPALSGNASYTRLDAVRTFGGRTLAAQEQESANLSLSVPLFVPSRWYQWSHAADQVSVARASEADVQRTAALTAARAYLTIVAQKRVIEVSGRAVDAARAHTEFARARRAAGMGNALDELRTEQQLATSSAQLENALTALARAQEALGVATGSDGPLDAAADPELRGPTDTPAEGLRDAAAVRADVRAARERAGAAGRVARDSWADWLPTVLATGQQFYNAPPSPTSPANGWQAQVAISFPIFEGFFRIGQRQERDALSAEARTQLDGLLLQARSEVRAAYASLSHADAALAESRRASDRAQGALRLVDEAYRAGATTSLDVIDAEQRSRDADTAAVVAEDAVREARLDLLAATGRFP